MPHEVHLFAREPESVPQARARAVLSPNRDAVGKRELAELQDSTGQILLQSVLGLQEQAGISNPYARTGSV